jgi:SAM-dependent methyltransferase
MPKKRESDLRTELMRVLLKMLPRGRFLDLACGHGTVSLIAKGLGWNVTAVDVRTKRMPKVRGIRWVESDVRDFAIKPREYDLIAALGLLYHLELKDQLDLLARCSTMPTIVDTHVSLNPTIEEMGYRGHPFDELGGRTAEEHAQSVRASWGNLVSFWPDEESLLRMFIDSGFHATFKLTPGYMEDRTFYLCLPKAR